MTRADVVDVDEDPAVTFDEVERRGWGDGLPVIPPTPERVGRWVQAAGGDPEREIGVVPPSQRVLTVEAIAANAVLAGMPSELMPLLLAASAAALDARLNLPALQATTNPVTTGLIVNGPQRTVHGVACDTGLLGPGFRANMTLGRALRLILLNVGGARPGHGDAATHGLPSKLWFVLGENEERSPWEPFSVARGVNSADAVTVVGVSCFVNNHDHASTKASDLLNTIAHGLRPIGLNPMQLGGETLVVLGPDHAKVLAREGLSRMEVQAELFARGVVPADAVHGPTLADLRQLRKQHPAVTGDILHCVDRPEDILVVVAGGTGNHTLVCPTFGDTRSVTVAVNKEPT